MKVAIIGASGFVGVALTEEALRRGHTVTGIARQPEKITQSGALLHTVQADVFQEGGIAPLLAGHDAVLSAYNAGWTNPRIYEDTLAGSEAIQAAVRESASAA